MDKRYKLKSVHWAVFDDGKVLPFVFNQDMTRIRVLGRKIDVDLVLNTNNQASYIENAYRKLEELRRCSCSRNWDKTYIAYHNIATKDEILDIAIAYEKIIKNNVKEKQLKEKGKFIDEMSRMF